VNPLNTVWTLVAAFLVFGMQVGFTMLEAGFCRSRETVNVLRECIVDTCLCGLLFFAFGFAFMVGHGNGLIGWGDADGTHVWFFRGDGRVPAGDAGAGPPLPLPRRRPEGGARRPGPPARRRGQRRAPPHPRRNLTH